MSVRGRMYICAGLLAFVAAGYHMLRLTGWARSATEPTPLAVPLAALPNRLGEWQGTDIAVPEAIAAIARTDSYLRRDYVEPGGGCVALYVAYYSNVHDTVPHGPTICYPSAGWVTKQDQVMTLSVDGLGERRLQKLVYAKGSTEVAILYWYCANGEQLAGTQWLRLDAARRKLFGLGGAYVIQVLLSVPVVTSHEQAFSLLTRFASKSFPALSRHFPEATQP